METPAQKIRRKTQVQMGGWHQTRHFPNEDKKLDNLLPESSEMEEEGRWDGQNFQQLKKVQCLEEEDEEDYTWRPMYIYDDIPSELFLK